MNWRAIPILFAACSIVAEEAQLPDLGPDWFARLRDPETATAALQDWDFELQKARGGKPPVRESDIVFASDHRNIRVVRCPQPGTPDAWLVIWDTDYHGSLAMLAGLHPDSYPPTQAEIDLQAKPVDVVWKPGEPWMESKGFFLTNEQGKMLADWTFLGCGVIADFDGDEMLDLIQFKRTSIRKKKEEEETAEKKRPESREIDLIQIGPLRSDLPRTHNWLCNLRDRMFSGREFRFDLRSRDGSAGLDFVLVSTSQPSPFDPNQPEMAVRQGELPESVFDLNAFSEDEHEAIEAFAKDQFGWETSGGRGFLTGWGSPDASEIRAGEPEKATFESRPEPFSSPTLKKGLSPGEIALATVEQNRDDNHRAKFDLVLGPPLPAPPKTGWILVEEDQGWGPDQTQVWWLRENGAEVWTFNPDHRTEVTSFVVAPISAEPLARWIATFQSLDRVRTVPKIAGLPHLDHDRFGGDDHTGYRIVAASRGPERRFVDFGAAFPSLWNALRGPYDRPAAAVMAALLGPHLATEDWVIEGIEMVEGEKVDLIKAAREWLKPDRVGQLPAPLSKQMVKSIGGLGRADLKPQLEALLDAWNPPGEAELELRQARRDKQTAKEGYMGYDPEFKAQKAYYESSARARELDAKMFDDPASQLRDEIELSLRKLAAFETVEDLQALAADREDPLCWWARQRLESLGIDVESD